MAKKYTTKPGVSLGRLDFWASAEMRDWVDREATKLGLQRSEYLRKIILEEQAREDKRNPDYKDTQRELARAIALLVKARKFENETVRDAGAMAQWRRQMDVFLADRYGDDPADRYDTPERVEHRAFIANLIRPRITTKHR